ncbi:MAG: sensor histidine kinase [Bryobacterales bacterium]|nr:sensor histidine kinase [Bryobacterales bacterium]
MVQALSALIRNGLEAGSEHAAMTLESGAGGGLRFVIEDRGHGMSPEVLRRIGEPFFTSKEPGNGMGLGVFLARTVAERLGGSLTYESEQGAGTRATLELPVDVAAGRLDRVYA